ncbi:MAG TPA: HupE/UreJ family protein [Longimicrobiales bacterium]|nr:HupE/UreJ family protein [Longimicrobiales bacterium]
MSGRSTRTWLCACLLAAAPGALAAHEVPADVTVQAYVRPAGRTLALLVRVPLTSMRDLRFPLRGPGYLVLGDELDRLLADAAALWIADYLRLYENGVPLGEERVVAARLSLPSDRSFVSFEGAMEHTLSGTLPASTDLVPEQALLDVLFEVAITDQDARFSIEPELAHLGLATLSVIHFLPPGGGERVFQYSGNPGLVHLDPRWHQAFLRFVKLGFLHILDGIDHLLFVLCLVIPFRRFAGLVPVVTAFTVAHSITLVASALGLAPSALWFPPLIEVLIAVSIVYLAFENMVGGRLGRRWMIAFAFGLVHGFGFSFALRESLQFVGGHLLTSLLAFNVGVELGQLFVLALAVPALGWLFGRVVRERPGTVLLSALVAHTAWHWMTERWTELRAYRFTWPAMDPATVATGLRWVMLALLCAGTAWALSGVFGWWTRAAGAPARAEAASSGER